MLIRAFHRVPGGLAYGLDGWEHELLARLALEARALLQANTPQEAGQSETSSPSRPDPVRPGESEQDRKVLKALDSDPDVPTNHVHPDHPSVDPVIAILLPQASEDPITSVEISSLICVRLRGGRVDCLARLAAELRAPSGPEGTVLVVPGQESDWPGTGNGIRLVLAQRLGIESAQDAERIHAATFQEAPKEEISREQWYRRTALVYDMATWWQESLVSVLFGDTGPAQSRGVNNAPIGMFDPGVGSLIVTHSALSQLPHGQVLYTGDIANGLYGPRDTAEVRSLALDIMDELVDRGAELFVIACNAAPTAVLHDARERYTLGRGVSVIEIIHPAARATVRVTHSGKMELIAIHRTVDSRAYDDALQAVPGVELVSRTCPRFVELAKRGVTTGPEVLDVAEEYLAPIEAADADTLILGCTHYSLLVGLISYVMRWDVTLVTSSDEIAKGIYRALAGKDLLRGPEVPEPHHDFASTGDPEASLVLARRFLSPEVIAVKRATFAPGAAGIPARLPHPPSPSISHQGSA